jgi:hypothetical protein
VLQFKEQELNLKGEGSMIRKLFFIKAISISILMGMTVAPIVLADTVTVNQVFGYHIGGGGEFTLRINKLLS